MSSLIKWPVIRLQELAINKKNAIVGGPFGSNLVSADYVSEGVPVVRGVNLPKDARFSLENLAFVTESKADSLKPNLAAPGDIVFTQRGTLGQVGIIPSDTKYRRFLISQSQMKMTVDPEKANPLYLYYYFRMPSTVTYIENHALQSGVPHINLGILRKLEIICPPINIQNKISATISAYDDLIENNKRRISLLEKMAEEIYREWFVRFRFSGYQTAEFEKGIPKGWERGKADQFFEHVKGKSYTSDEISELDENSMPFVTLKSFNRGGGYRGDGLKSYAGKFSDKQIVFEGDVVMAVTDMTQNREVVGRVARIPDLGEKGAVISLDVIKLVPKTISATYLYSYMKYSGFGDFIKSFANGANVLHLKPDLVTQQVIVVPPEELRNKFDAFVTLIHEQVGVLTKEIENLEKTKESLLPRLISGKLSVADLDIQFPPSMVDDEAA